MIANLGKKCSFCEPHQGKAEENDYSCHPPLRAHRILRSTCLCGLSIRIKVAVREN